uniref:Reverse transcriptase domain-containing protein n=1 Tax=Pyropia yezoensis TaxID=2788 RepID=I0B718_PYRYE|nr:hypothetical protein PyyeM_p19 [Neopyropia yezoensis]AFH57686.1 hypothetical protein [Neopyropia yezoensis]QGA30558.1 hypothetical protein PyyeMp19 [Neopyropia yezoensis]
MLYNLYIKTINLLISGQQKEDYSMLIKEFWNSKLRVILHTVRLTNSFYNQPGGYEVPIIRNNEVSHGESFYIVRPLQEWSGTQNLSKIFKAEENLKVVINGKRKNSGNPESWKTGGFGGIVVRNISCLAYVRKGPSSEAILNSKLSGYESIEVGLNNIDKQVLEYIKTGKRIEGLSSLLRNPNFLIASYSKIKSNKGALTPGLSNETLDGIKLEWFEKAAESIVNGSYHFEPVRRKFIPKPKGGERPLGIPNPRDKIIQEGMRQLLELVYERIFVDSSHGFRPNKSCHSALNQVKMTMGYSSWFIEGDISKYFDTVNHTYLVSKIAKVIKDQAFIDLIYKVLKAGYGFSKRNVVSTSRGFPQGGVISPILANIYLHDFDLKILEMSENFNRGVRRKANPEYTKMVRDGKVDRKNFIYPAMGNDAYFKRMKYVRYADDFLIGIIGSKADCEGIRTSIASILKEEFLLELNIEKTKITHAKHDCAFFLGHNIHISMPPKDKIQYLPKRGNKLVRTTSRPLLDAPIGKIVLKLGSVGYCKTDGSPRRFGKLLHEPMAEIIYRYKILQSGLLNYYSMANNYGRLSARIHWTLKYSCALTIASKMKLGTLKKVFKHYGANLEIKNEKGEIIQCFPKISYSRPKNPIKTKIFDPIDHIEKSSNYFKRSLATFEQACMLCGKQDTTEMHHINKLKNNSSTDWLTSRMVKMNRKQIPVCRNCHQLIHKGKYDGSKII